MKVLLTINDLSASSGGPTTCTCDLMNALFKVNHEVRLLTRGVHDENDILVGYGEEWLKTFPCDYITPLQYSNNIKNVLQETDVDLYHCNGLWMYSNHITCKVARDKSKPYILSPHGMLYSNALRYKRWKKWPMLKLWFDKDVHKADCLHATCDAEARHIRTYGYKGPIAVIPNPVVFPEYATLATSKPEGKIQIGFLGRLNPIKKIEQVLYALAALAESERSQFVFKIMGKGWDDYESFLRSEVNRLGLNDLVDFVGFVNGEEKYSRLRDLSALFVPSESENFGMIVPEALICGTPVYASTGTPWSELNNGYGWWRDNTVENITNILRELLSMPQNEILAMGAKGRLAIEQTYRDTIVAEKMQKLYQWVMGEISQPEFVQTL